MSTPPMPTPSGSAAIPDASGTSTCLTVSAPPPSGRFRDTIFDFNEIIVLALPLTVIEKKISHFVRTSLASRCGCTWDESDDNLFMAHTILVETLLKHSRNLPIGLELFPVRIWENHLHPMVDEAEKELRKVNASARIHKGAPYYNAALCLFIAGDFHRSFQFFAKAGKEDELSGRGSCHLVPIGVNSLAEQVIIDPLIPTVVPQWATDFLAITGTALNKTELQSVITWLAQRAPDAYQVITALHRFRQSGASADNAASQYQMVRSLADLVLPVESSLRRWQIGTNGQLFTRTKELLNANSTSRRTFDAFHTNFINTWSEPQRETGAAVNWVVSEAVLRLSSASSVAERIGVAAYLIVRLRNTLMHVNEETLDFHTNSQLCLRVAGIAFAVLRIAKHGNDGTLSSL